MSSFYPAMRAAILGAYGERYSDSKAGDRRHYEVLIQVWPFHLLKI